MTEDSVSPDRTAPPKAAVASGSVRDPDSGNPGQSVADSVEACLDIARTWHAWDGRPLARSPGG